MPMPIDVRGLFEPGWTNAGTSTEPDEPMKTRLAILQSLEHKMALAQGRAEKGRERNIQLYEAPLERHPSLDISMNPNADKTIYVNSLFLGKSYPDMEYRMAAMLITEQLRPENWTQLSPDAKIETISLLEQTMAIQETRNAVDSSGAAVAPPVSRPVRPISAEEGADKPLYLLSDTGLVIGKDKLAGDTAGLDILDAMVCAQLDYKKWNNSPPESRLSTLQLAEYGMAARQGRFPRLIKEETMGKEKYGSYNSNTPDILKISLEKLKSSVNEDFTRFPLKARTISEFPNFEMLDTVIHEGRHAAQHDVIHGILKPETLGITPELAEQWKQNDEAYLTSRRYTYSAYRFQAIEADANDTAYKRICQDFSGMLGESLVYQEYLTLKRNDRQLQEQSAKGMFGEKYLDEIGEIVAQEHDAKTRKEVQPIDLKPGSNLDDLLIQFGDRLKSQSSSPLMLKSSAVSLLEEALLTEVERQLTKSEKEKSIHSKLPQLHFGETSFPQLCQRTGNTKRPEGYDIIYAAALLTEAMEGRRLVSDGDAMPGPASLKIGSNFAPVLRPVPTVPRVKPKPPEPVPRLRPTAPMGGQTQTQSRTRPGAPSGGRAHLPDIGQSRPRQRPQAIRKNGQRAAAPARHQMGVIPQSRPPIIQPVSQQQQLTKNLRACLQITSIRPTAKRTSALTTPLSDLAKPEEDPAYLEALHQYETREGYNGAAIRHATAMQFKMLSNTMHPSLAERQGVSYGYSEDDKMPPHEFGIAVGVMLNRGYKMSDILDPDKLKASKSILGKSIKEAFQSASPHLIKNGSQLLEDAANGYKKFKLQSELRHLDSKAESEEDTVRMFADSRFQPGILRMIGGFGEAFHEFQSYYPTVCSEISVEKRTNIEKNMDNVRNMCSILSPERVKAVFDYYQSPEYLHGTVSATKEPEQKAAEATLIIQEHLVRNQNKFAAEQMEDSAAFEAIPEIHTQIDGLKSMNAEQLSAYIQKNHPIDQFLSRARGGSAAAVSPSPVVTAVPPPVSSDLDAENTQAKPVEAIELATLIESIHGVPEKMASKVKPVVIKPIIKKPEEAGRRK